MVYIYIYIVYHNRNDPRGKWFCCGHLQKKMSTLTRLIVGSIIRAQQSVCSWLRDRDVDCENTSCQLRLSETAHHAK